MASIQRRIFVIIFVSALLTGVISVILIFSKKSNFDDINEKSREEQVIDNRSSDDNNVLKLEERKSVAEFLKLASGRVFAPRLIVGTNKVLFYQEQKFLTVNPYSGEKYSVGAYPFVAVENFFWNSSGDKAIVRDSGEYYLFNFQTNSIKRFEEKVDKAIWNEKGNKIFYKYYDSRNHKRQVKSIDFDGNNKVLVVDDLPYRRIEMIIQPTTGRFCYFPLPDARVKGKLFCQNADGSELKELGGNYGQDYLWSPDGEKILTSFAKDETGSQLVLGVMNKNGGEFHGLAFPTTVRKCVWSKDSVNVYCALLGNIPTVVMLPNFWQEKSFDSVDTFWKINTETGKKSRLVEVEKMKQGDKELLFDATNLLLDPEEEFLFFIDRRQGDLWRIKIK